MGEPVFCSRQRVSAGPPPAIPLGKTAVQAAATERRRGQSRAREGRNAATAFDAACAASRG